MSDFDLMVKMPGVSRCAMEVGVLYLASDQNGDGQIHIVL